MLGIDPNKLGNFVTRLLVDDASPPTICNFVTHLFGTVELTLTALTHFHVALLATASMVPLEMVHAKIAEPQLFFERGFNAVPALGTKHTTPETIIAPGVGEVTHSTSCPSDNIAAGDVKAVN
eukprot:CAMPEP_0172753638 /NCGR_PEP_ID=MMETSP1074-20121228/156369_1 /TAXON_ID=2916 /ORGANISM="Ceratium fusus, Strain PA161109" /LENGTH=122 /DNA_ID=CAMNT_0013586359 /DNA_START=245 /DNA_END=610 /DNA_ORIENTATION=-